MREIYNFSLMSCNYIPDTTIEIGEKANVNCAFHLAVLEASLNFLSQLVSEKQLEAMTDSFYRNETPMALQEAHEALAALKLALADVKQEAG